MHTIMCPRPKAHECDLQWWQSLTSARCQEVGFLLSMLPSTVYTS